MADIDKNELKNITKLVSNYCWSVSIWEKRYGPGFYGMVCHPRFINDIQDITTGADVEAVEFESYIYDNGSWFPIASGDTLVSVLVNLELKLAKLVNNDDWIDKVTSVMERIIEENDGNYGLRIAIDNDKEAIFNWKG